MVLVGRLFEVGECFAAGAVLIEVIEVSECGSCAQVEIRETAAASEAKEAAVKADGKATLAVCEERLQAEVGIARSQMNQATSQLAVAQESQAVAVMEVSMLLEEHEASRSRLRVCEVVTHKHQTDRAQ